MAVPELLHLAIPGWLRLLPHARAGSTRPKCLWKIGYRCRENGRQVAYDRDYGLWLSRVQGNSVCCCWRRVTLHKRSGELLPSVCCSSGKIGSNRWSHPKKDIVGMFAGLFFVDQNWLFGFDHSLHFCVSWFHGRRWHCHRQRATWIRKLAIGSITGLLKIE